MLPRRALFIAAVFLSAASVARADVPATQTRAPSDAVRRAAFDALVQQAYQARLAGRDADAARLFKSALEMQHHPVISGQLGVLLVKLGQMDKAAEELHEGVTRGFNVAAPVLQEVALAFQKARLATTWVQVEMSHAGAKVLYDDTQKNPEGYSTFWMYALPGEHTVRASLDGYEDAVATFTAKAGEEITVTLRFIRRPDIEPADPTKPILEQLKRQKRIFPPPFRGSNVWGDENYDPKEDPNYGEPKETKPVPKDTGMRFSVMAGVVTVFGVASWNPAVGPVVGVGLRPKEWLSFGLEGRAAWLTTGVGDRNISAMTGGGNLLACGHVKWFFGCGVGHLGAINVKFSDTTYKEKSTTHLRPGAGGRIGAEIKPWPSFAFRGVVDVLALANRHEVWAGDTLVADQAPWFIATQLLGGWEF